MPRTSLTTPFDKTLVMGILNITPDSFFDGGKFMAAAECEKQAAELAASGADILDLGAESSRPGALPVDAAEEWARLEIALPAALETGLPVSVDTRHGATARLALASGAAMINDISGLRDDPDMVDIISEHRAACVIMHMQGTPETMQQAPRYDDVISDLCAFFEERIAFSLGRGIREDKIWLDPGFGFGKSVAHNLELLRRLDEFKCFGLPMLIGTSNKSTIGAVLGTPVDDRAEGTAATVAIAICKGVDCVRVHDVRAMARVARMCDAVLRGR